MLKNLKVRSKLLISYGIVILFYIIAIIAATISLGNVFGGLENFYNTPFPMVRSALEVQSLTREIQMNVYKAVTSDHSQFDTINSGINNTMAARDAAMEELRATYEGDASLLQSVESAAQKTKDARAKALKFVESNNSTSAISILNGEYATAADEFEAALNQVIDEANSIADDYYQTGARVKTISDLILVALAAVSVIISLILVFSIVKNLTHPILEIENAVQGMAKGDMSAEVTYKSNDELGSLAENLRTVLSTLSSYIRHICDRLDSLADGDLTVEMDMDYLGEFASIKESGAKIIHSLNDTLSQLHQASDQVANGSEQVSSGAQALSQGATEQASSVQELAATLGELSGQVNANAENSRDVNQLISDTSKEIHSSNEKMESMVKAMANINDCSSQIEKIIKTIEDIAFQTNILALNASVEAARAGEAGKGFSVVANEIRALAEDTQKMTRNMGSFVDNMKNASRQSISSSTSTIESLASMAEKIGHVWELNNDSQRYISNVNESVSSIAAVSEEISSSMAEMENQLKDCTDFMRQVGMDLQQATEPVVDIEKTLDTTVKQMGSLTQDAFFHLENAEFADYMQNAVSSHHAWLGNLKKMVNTREIIPLQLDSSKCGFGHFYYAMTPDIPGVLPIWEGLGGKHRKFHTYGAAVMNAISRGDYSESERLYWEAENYSRELIADMEKIIQLTQEN